MKAWEASANHPLLWKGKIHPVFPSIQDKCKIFFITHETWQWTSLLMGNFGRNWFRSSWSTERWPRPSSTYRLSWPVWHLQGRFFRWSAISRLSISFPITKKVWFFLVKVWLDRFIRLFIEFIQSGVVFNEGQTSPLHVAQSAGLSQFSQTSVAGRKSEKLKIFVH